MQPVRYNVPTTICRSGAMDIFPHKNCSFENDCRLMSPTLCAWNENI